MDSCVARPDIVEEISAIAKEEAMGYFYGSRARKPLQTLFSPG